MKSRMVRKPTPVGEMLIEEFLKPLGLTQVAFARHIGVDFKTINRIVRGRQVLTPEVAMKFAAAFNMSVEFWLNLQMLTDVWKLSQVKAKLPKPLVKAS